MSNIDKFIGPTKFLCEVIGMWPVDVNSQTISEKIFTIFRRIFSLLAIGNVVGPQLFAIIENHGNLVVVTRIGCLSLNVFLCGYNIIYLIFHGQELARIYFAVRDLWGAGKSSREQKVYEGFAWKGKIFTIAFFLAGFTIDIIFITAAIFDWIVPIYRGEIAAASKLQRHLPFEVRYGFDVESSPNFEVAFVYQTISMVLCCIGVVGLDSLMLTLILHVCGQFALIQFWYRDIRRKMMAHNETDRSYILHREVHRCIRHHQEIIRLADDLEALFSPIIFVQFVTSAVEICLSGFAVTTGVDETMDLVRFSSYLVGAMVKLCVWYVVGEMLIEESENVGNAILQDVCWYEFPINLQRDLHLVLLRSQKCCRLTAAKFGTMDIATLGTTLSSGFSYFTVLRQLK